MIGGPPPFKGVMHHESGKARRDVDVDDNPNG
jgi:hypothetical protein